MRVASLVVIGLVLALANPAWGTLCPDCRKGGPYTKDIGECTRCKERRTGSGEHQLCFKCSADLKVCEHCAKALPAAKPATQPIDLKSDGKYTAGKWEFRYTVTNKGFRSEGYVGELLWDGKPAPEPETTNDFYQTPWGPIYWVGRPVVAFGMHGWMPRPRPSAKVGRQLPDPAGAKPDAAAPKPDAAKADAAALRLWVRVVQPDRQPVPDLAPLDEWIREEFKKREWPAPVACSDWQPLTDEVYVIHDSRHYGYLQVHLGKSADPRTLVADFGGTESCVELARERGATKLVHVPLQSSIARLDLYLAFKVEP